MNVGEVAKQVQTHTHALAWNNLSCAALVADRVDEVRFGGAVGVVVGAIEEYVHDKTVVLAAGYHDVGVPFREISLTGSKGYAGEGICLNILRFFHEATNSSLG